MELFIFSGSKKKSLTTFITVNLRLVRTVV